VWQSIIPFQRLSVSVINTSHIPCYEIVSSGALKFPWTKCLLHNLGNTWSHGWHLVDSIIALFSKSFTLPNVDPLIHCKLLFRLIAFTCRGVAFLHQECSWMHPKQPVWCVPCMVWCFSMRATQFRRPKRLNRMLESSSNLRKYYRSYFQVNGQC